MNVLVTGADGFVGAALTPRLAEGGTGRVRAAVRNAAPERPGVERTYVGDIGPDTNWDAALTGVDAVVHLAAKVHSLKDVRSAPAADEYRRVNTAGTIRLAERAAALGVRRLVFLSSVKVNGDEGRFSEDDAPAPGDAYAVSKHEAEVALRQLAARTSLQVVIIRPPLVYGPGVKANFRSLIRAVSRGVPLPFGLVRNRRSLVAVDNLADFIAACLEHPSAPGQTFLVSDGEDVSTADLIRRIGIALGRPARLVPVPVGILTAGAAALGRREVSQRLVGSLQVDIAKARQQLGWAPPIGLDEGLRRTVRAG